MSSDGPANPSPQEARSWTGRVRTALLLGFCCWHALFLIASIAPRKRVPGAKGNTALNSYRLFIGGPQQWNLFETIPDHHSLEPRIVVDDGAGGRTTLGCVLPGFAEYPRPEKARYYNMFFHLVLNAQVPSLFEAYLRRAEAGIKARSGGALPGRWELVVDVDWTRTLVHSRRDGRLYVPATRSFDVANPGGISR